jgi:hypothetical protein
MAQFPFDIEDMPMLRWMGLQMTYPALQQAQVGEAAWSIPLSVPRPGVELAMQLRHRTVL